MKSLSAVAFAVLLVGCAQDFVTHPNDLSVKDFAPADDPTIPDDSGGGVTDGGADLAMRDLTAVADLTNVPATCDLSMATADAGTQARLYLAGIVSGNALASASFNEGAGWSAVAVDGTHGVADVAVAVGAGGQPVIVAHENDSGGTLGFTTPDRCTGVNPALAPLYSGAASYNRPSLTSGATVDVVFRGKFDQHLYHASWDGTSWTTGTQLALLTDQWPQAVRAGGVVHAIHTGTFTDASKGGQLYDGTFQGGGTAVAMSTSASDQGPAAVAASDGTIYAVFPGVDTNLYWQKLPSGGTWSAPVQLCTGLGGSCLDTSDKQPLLALGADGKPVVVWHGTNNHLYTATLSDGVTPPWSAAIEATGGELTNGLPGIAGGVGSANAELVYVRADGVARHSRLTGTWSTPSTIGNQTWQGTPALAH